MSNLHEEMPVVLELQNLTIGGAICTDPHIVVFIHVYPMFRLRPIESFPGTAPGVKQVSLSIEFEDGRGGEAAH